MEAEWERCSRWPRNWGGINEKAQSKVLYLFVKEVYICPAKTVQTATNGSAKQKICLKSRKNAHSLKNVTISY